LLFDRPHDRERLEFDLHLGIAVTAHADSSQELYERLYLVLVEWLEMVVRHI
jgi:hypothetical protein